MPWIYTSFFTTQVSCASKWMPRLRANTTNSSGKLSHGNLFRRDSEAQSLVAGFFDITRHGHAWFFYRVNARMYDSSLPGSFAFPEHTRCTNFADI
jgi:hypothetical protein